MEGRSSMVHLVGKYGNTLQPHDRGAFEPLCLVLAVRAARDFDPAAGLMQWLHSLVGRLLPAEQVG